MDDRVVGAIDFELLILGAVFGGVLLPCNERIVDGLDVGKFEDGRERAAGSRGESVGIDGARAGVEIRAEIRAF